jgi:serine/threonine protein kinase
MERGDGSRFWIDGEVEIALATIMSYEIYSGQVVERSESTDAVLMCIQETIPPMTGSIPDFVMQLQAYTEKECRAICLQVAKCIEILHNAGIAHRNLHLDNLLIDLLVS